MAFSASLQTRSKFPPSSPLKTQSSSGHSFFQATSIMYHWSYNSSFSTNYRKLVNATWIYSMPFPYYNCWNKAVAYTNNVEKQTGYRTCHSYRDSKGWTTDGDCKGSWHWVSQTSFLSIRQTTGYAAIFSKLQYDIIVRHRIILHSLRSAQARFTDFSFYSGITDLAISQFPVRSVSSNNKQVPSPYWRALGAQTSCRGHWSPWCKGRAAKSQMRFSARNKRETWEKEEWKKKKKREKDGELESRSTQRQMEITSKEQHRQKECRQGKDSETRESIIQVRKVEPFLES